MGYLKKSYFLILRNLRKPNFMISKFFFYRMIKNDKIGFFTFFIKMGILKEIPFILPHKFHVLIYFDFFIQNHG